MFSNITDDVWPEKNSIYLQETPLMVCVDYYLDIYFDYLLAR